MEKSDIICFGLINVKIELLGKKLRVSLRKFKKKIVSLQHKYLKHNKPRHNTIQNMVKVKL